MMHGGNLKYLNLSRGKNKRANERGEAWLKWEMKEPLLRRT
jgi:hypothetical protein